MPRRRRYRQCGRQGQLRGGPHCHHRGEWREDIRRQRLAEEHTSCVAAAAAKKTAIEQQAMVEAMGKGDGQGSAGKSYPARASSIKYAPYENSANEKDCVASVVKVGSEAARAQES